jgi:predicted ATP-grasp superfamily ATP-dependent carboligase
LHPIGGTLGLVRDESARWLAERPKLREPVLVVVLSGWIDASGAAKTAVDAIAADASADPILEFDDDVYVDYRARRPVMELREGFHSVLHWERILLSAGRDQTGRDLLVLHGPEPDMAWHRFTRLVGELAVELEVKEMAHLGAYPFAVPHTRPARISVSSPSHEVLSHVPFLRSTIDVPAGVAAALEREMHDRGIPSLGIWAQVPHYISQMPYPSASVALLEGLREATGLVFDAAELRAEVISQGRKLDRLVANNPEHESMLHQLEQLYDAGDDVADIQTAGPSLEYRSGDELAAEVEEFLRDQD